MVLAAARTGCPSSLQHRQDGARLSKQVARASRTPNRPSRTRAVIYNAASMDYGDQEGGSVKRYYVPATEVLVAASSVPFAVLVVPQLLQNQMNLATGNFASLGAVSWVAVLSAVLGNTLMLSHFVDRGEKAAAAVQLIGMASNVAVLYQMYVAKIFSPVALALTVGLAVASLVVNFLRYTHALPTKMFRQWQLTSALLGFAALPQIVTLTLWPSFSSLLPAVLGFTAVLAWYKTKVQPHGTAAELEKTSAGLPGWAATLLFSFSPIPQLVANFSHPNSLEGLAVGSMLLGLLGNGLAVPRALLTKDTVWIIGAGWSCMAVGAQLLSLFMGRSAITGVRYLGGTTFGGILGAMVLYFLAVLVMDSRIKGLSSPWASLKDVFKAKAE